MAEHHTDNIKNQIEELIKNMFPTSEVKHIPIDENFKKEDDDKQLRICIVHRIIIQNPPTIYKDNNDDVLN